MAASTKSTKGKKSKPTITRIKANDRNAPKRTVAAKVKQSAAADVTTKSTPSAKDKPVSKVKKLLGGTRKSKNAAGSKKALRQCPKKAQERRER